MKRIRKKEGDGKHERGKWGGKNKRMHGMEEKNVKGCIRKMTERRIKKKREG